MKVFRVDLKASFYVLANDGIEAEMIADREHPISNMELPVTSRPYYTSYLIPAQDDYHRRRCTNYEDETLAEQPK